ncbi:MAG: XshC-Cox1 family protein [Nitriliruptorales bacterium]|nr:XshC-Cox1 family protein [Nitriliruptorales bacterium]
MRDILSDLRRWHTEGTPVGLATVVGVQQSAPRQPGASMALAADGTVMGSVSGGCVEGAVVEVAQQVLADGAPQLSRYGFSDDEAFAVGLTCGGQIDIFVERVDPAVLPGLPAIADAVAAGRPVAVATVLTVPDAPGPAHGVRPGAKLIVWPDSVDGTLGNEGIDAAVTDDARGFLEQGITGQRRYGARGERRLEDLTVFVEALAPRPRMLVFGAIDFASAVARVGVLLGYHVTVCDARAVFATPLRFPQAHEVVVEWPHRYLARTRVDSRTVICVLTHDPKFDVPLLEVALRTDATYIGAMGSRRTHEDRLDRLRERGLTDEELVRLHSPIGLDLGARTPEETAVSVAAEIIAERWGGSGRPLSETEGQIHRPGQALVSP